MTCCLNAAQRNAVEDRWLWKRVGDFQLRVKWGMADTTPARVSTLPFHTYGNVAHCFCAETFGLEWSWNTHGDKRGGVLVMSHRFLVALNKHMGEKMWGFGAECGNREHTCWIKHVRSTPVSHRRCPLYLCHFRSPGTLITLEPFLEHCGAVNMVSMETSARHTLISGLEQLYFSDDEWNLQS